jgi:uncharacterized protein (DUF4415 family)
MFMKTPKIKGTPEGWEDGRLGRDEAHAQPAPKELAQQIDEGLGLQMISIRLQKELIEDYKKIAEFHGVGYQPLMRDALKRFADVEFKKIAIEYANLKASQAAGNLDDATTPTRKSGPTGKMAA